MRNSVKRYAQVAVMAIASAVGGAGMAHAQQEVKIGYALADTSHYGVAAKTLAESVEQATNGKFKFRQFPSTALGGEREVVEGLQLGTVEATIVSTGALSNFVPAVGVTDIPFLFRDLDHARRVLDGPVGEDILAQFEPRGLVALAWGEQGFRHITNSKHPINEPADLAGLKLRTMENPIHIAAFETLGGAPTPMAWPDVIGALQQRTIDGQENPLSVIVSAKLNEVQKYLTLTGHVYSPAILLVSKSFYDNLSDADKAAFEAGATKAVEAMRAYVSEVEQSGVATLKDRGMQINELSAEQRERFREKLAPAYQRYSDQFGKDLIEKIIATE